MSAEGELVSLLGWQRLRKSTTLKTVLGLVRPRNGSVEFRGEEITDRTTSYRIQREWRSSRRTGGCSAR
jgi:ABC-type branched-subunit amino acid transport system ATPase component